MLNYISFFLCKERSCRKAWSFTRVPRFEFVGDSNEEISDVKSIAECRSLCLAATLFECRSATYDSNSRLCRLTEETKRSAPSEFRPADFGIDYLENECADGKMIVDQYLVYSMDINLRNITHMNWIFAGKLNYRLSSYFILIIYPLDSFIYIVKVMVFFY